MITSPFTHVGSFLIETLFSLYVFILLIRLLLQWRRADFYQPICQFVIRATQPVIKPFQKILPDIKGIDLAVVFVAYVVECIQFTFIFSLVTGTFIGYAQLFVMGAMGLIHQLLNLLFFLILVRAILSWVKAQPSAVAEVIYLITEPILRPARRLIPAFSGIDLSPILVLIVIRALAMLVSPMNWL